MNLISMDTKKYLMTNHFNKAVGAFGITLAFFAASCGDDNKSAGDHAKDATNAVTKTASDVKEAVVNQFEDTRPNIEKKLTQASEDFQAKANQLEQKYNAETAPEIKATSKKRLDALKNDVAAANKAFEDLKKSSDEEWKVKKDATLQTLEATNKKVASAIERQKFSDDVKKKMDVVQAKIESLKDEAAAASTDAKKKIEASRASLEKNWDQLKVQYSKFQSAADDKWEGFKTDFGNIFTDISKTFKDLFK